MRFRLVRASDDILTQVETDPYKYDYIEINTLEELLAFSRKEKQALIIATTGDLGMAEAEICVYDARLD